MKNVSCRGLFVIFIIFGISVFVITWNDLHPLFINQQRLLFRGLNEWTAVDTGSEKVCMVEERIRSIERMCSTLDNYQSRGIRDQTVMFNMMLDQNHNISYCQIQKVGSTFIRKMLGILKNKSNVSKTPEGERIRIKDLKGSKSIEEIESSVNNSMKFLFIREPYGRAFSGYVDKLFAPNPVYWGSTGAFIMKRIRNSSQKCGHDVTFSEFIQYLIISQRKQEGRDRHFYPMYDHCSPCKIRYDFVGKMDTFKNDILCLLDIWNKKYATKISFDDFERENDERMALSQVARLYGMRSAIEKCMSFHEAIIRVWKDLQIRGIIPKEKLFPFREQETENMQREYLGNFIIDIIRNITDRKITKQQRKEALEEAYSLVPVDILQGYRETYDLDFTLFGYEKFPPFTLQKDDKSHKSLEYFNVNE